MTLTEPAVEARDGVGIRRDVIVDGHRIAYLEAGQGDRTVVLLHGLAASWDYWHRTIPALAETHRVIAVDLPGFGRSEKRSARGLDDLRHVVPALFDAVGVDRCDLIGHSMGTLVACEIAARHPDRIDRVVLSGGPITSVIDLFNNPIRTLSSNPRVATFLIEAATAGLRPPASVRRLILGRRWARWLATRPYVPHPAKLADEDVAGILVGVGAPGVFSTLREGFGYDLRPALAGVDRPIIVVNGERDLICPPADARAFAADNDAVEAVHIIPDVGHWAMLEAPDEFNEIVVEFLQRSRAAESGRGSS
ncbi:alpha/beta fold hydrolase [Gordonia soli]|nr:alpha/beta hydrolase [Gordonia soli]